MTKTAECDILNVSLEKPTLFSGVLTEHTLASCVPCPPLRRHSHHFIPSKGEVLPLLTSEWQRVTTADPT